MIFKIERTVKLLNIVKHEIRLLFTVFNSFKSLVPMNDRQLDTSTTVCNVSEI